MKFRQPCKINGFAFESHAVRHLLRNGLPAQPLLLPGRQRAPAIDDFDVTHAPDHKSTAPAVPNFVRRSETSRTTAEIVDPPHRHDWLRLQATLRL